MRRVNLWARRVKAEIVVLYLALRHPRSPWYARALMGLTLLYALSPIDLIPDFVPVLGYLDDVILLPLGIVLALRLVPADVRAECRAQAQSGAALPAGWGRFGAALIALLWLLLIILFVSWVMS